MTQDDTERVPQTDAIKTVPPVSGTVTAKLALVFFFAMPLTASALVFTLINIIEFVSTGSLEIKGGILIPTIMIYALPIGLFIAPLADHRYRKLRATQTLTASALLCNGFKLGVGVPLGFALLFSGFAFFVQDAGVLAFLALVYAAVGSIIGPVVAIIFGPILRRVDPRYR